MTAYTVTNKLGLFAAGRMFAQGESVDLEDDVAASLLAVGAVAPVSAPPKRRTAKN